MYVALPQGLLSNVHPQLYFPYFGALRNATHATFGINCGPPEAEYDSLGVRMACWNVTMSSEQTALLIRDPELTARPAFYFAYGQQQTPPGLGHPHPGGFWSFFNCGTTSNLNPFHRDHYSGNSLVHIDGVPWATCRRWAEVPENIATELVSLSVPVLRATLEAGVGITNILVRGRTAASFLEACGLGPTVSWTPSRADERFEFGAGTIRLRNRREIRVIAISRFHNLPRTVAPELLEIIHN